MCECVCVCVCAAGGSHQPRDHRQCWYRVEASKPAGGKEGISSHKGRQAGEGGPLTSPGAVGLALWPPPPLWSAWPAREGEEERKEGEGEGEALSSRSLSLSLFSFSLLSFLHSLYLSLSLHSLHKFSCLCLLHFVFDSFSLPLSSFSPSPLFQTQTRLSLSLSSLRRASHLASPPFSLLLSSPLLRPVCLAVPIRLSSNTHLRGVVSIAGASSPASSFSPSSLSGLAASSPRLAPPPAPPSSSGDAIVAAAQRQMGAERGTSQPGSAKIQPRSNQDPVKIQSLSD